MMKKDMPHQYSNKLWDWAFKVWTYLERIPNAFFAWMLLPRVSLKSILLLPMSRKNVTRDACHILNQVSLMFYGNILDLEKKFGTYIFLLTFLSIVHFASPRSGVFGPHGRGHHKYKENCKLCLFSLLSLLAFPPLKAGKFE